MALHDADVDHVHDGAAAVSAAHRESVQLAADGVRALELPDRIVDHVFGATLELDIGILRQAFQRTSSEPAKPL